MVAWRTGRIFEDCGQSLLADDGYTFYRGILVGSIEVKEIWSPEGIIAMVEMDRQRFHRRLGKLEKD